MTKEEIDRIFITNKLDKKVEIKIRICGLNNNNPVPIDSYTLIEKPYSDDYNGYEVILNCLETEEVEPWSQEEIMND